MPLGQLPPPGPARLDPNRIPTMADIKREVARHGGGTSGVSNAPGWPSTTVDNLPLNPHAKNDEYDGTTATSWTVTPTAPAVMNVNSTAEGQLFIQTAVNNGALVGQFQSMPSFPFAFASKLATHTATAGSSRTGIFISPAAPTNSTVAFHFGWINNGSVVQRVAQQFGGTFSGNGGSASFASQPLYLMIIVSSATAVSFVASSDGSSWTTIENVNPGFTPAIMGSYASSENTSGGFSTARFEWFRIKTL